MGGKMNSTAKTEKKKEKKAEEISGGWKKKNGVEKDSNGTY